MRILVVEDNLHLRRAVVAGLAAEGHAVDACGDGEEALWHTTGATYDLVVLDLGLPGVGGDAVLRRYRTAGGLAPVLILTARDEIAERVRLLDSGADDYLTKPFAAEELLARCRALLRRGHQQRDPHLQVGDLTINTAARRVTCGGVDLPLSPREYALLAYLAIRLGAVVGREELWEHLYDFQNEATSNVIDATVAHLRRKLAAAGAVTGIMTRRGQGYELRAGP